MVVKNKSLKSQYLLTEILQRMGSELSLAESLSVQGAALPEPLHQNNLGQLLPSAS